MTTLTLLQLNDLHGYLEPHPELVRTEGGWRVERLGGVARIARLFEEARAEGPCLTLDNGDTFHGTRVAVASGGEALVPIMNALKIDAMTAHWEFAYGPAGFKAWRRDWSIPSWPPMSFAKMTARRCSTGDGCSSAAV